MISRASGGGLVCRAVLVAALVAVLSWPAPGVARSLEAPTFPERPGERDFIVDVDGVLSSSREAAIRTQLDALLTEKAIPIIVVTIDSLDSYGATGMSIETYARRLFDAWGIGHEKVTVRGPGMGREDDVSWNRGILLLVAVEDRKARIALGADWEPSRNAVCHSIMQDHILPSFRRGDYADGIERGVTALAAMARGKPVPMPPRPLSHYLAVLAFVVLAILTVTSLVQSGSSGWAWVFWGIVLSILASLLWIVLTSPGRRRGFGGGSFGGGSFGGGFSGGGGATGSW